MTSAQRSVFPPSLLKPLRKVREHEILRVATSLLGDDAQVSLDAARREVLRWAQPRSGGSWPAEAWRFESFEYLSSGRSCSAVRHKNENGDVWAFRIEDPDKTVPGRIWTIEIVVSSQADLSTSFTLRLTVGSPEASLDIEPHVPGVVRQVITSPGLAAGTFKVTDKALTIRSVENCEVLIRALLDPLRKLPIIVLSVPSTSTELYKPLLDAKTLAAACAGLAIVIILPAQFSWYLTERFGKQLSVYEGAARIYLPGFAEDANPFGGHELLLPQRFASSEGAAQALTRLRWAAANGSVRRLQLGKDILAFASLRAQSLQQRQAELQNVGATDRERYEAAITRLSVLEDQLNEAERYQQEFSDLHDAAEERAETAEAQLRAGTFRIQQLLEQLETSGLTPDAGIDLPLKWEDFANWCDVHLAGRVILTPQARRAIRSPEFEDVQLAAKCLLWLANEYRVAKMGEGDGTLRDRTIVPGVTNTHCGSDCFEMEWQGGKHYVDWHIKNGGNTRDPKRCLRIYYFWAESLQQVVIASMPAHRRSDAS
ncbi:MAG TPA: hypothetical protein VK814_03560 [Acidobacteriaceae bacterium]|jgi:hypothetical protein|nr:hypothetical protein [Acidobacteriaceae bacterium]